MNDESSNGQSAAMLPLRRMLIAPEPIVTRQIVHRDSRTPLWVIQAAAADPEHYQVVG